MSRLVLIDGNSIMNRAFYGIMSSKMLTTSDGTYTNAVYGFLAILFKLEDVSYYTVSVLDEKPETEEIEILPEGWTTSEIILATAITLLIFW